jgi:hypothetical protein
LSFEDLINREESVLKEVYSFLGVREVDNINEILKKDIGKNKAKLPQYKFIVWISYHLQYLKLGKLGRYILRLSLVEKRPPIMPKNMRQYLEKELKDDIRFYKEISAK